MPFWNQNGMVDFTFLMIPFWFQKGTKKYKIFMKIIFSKNMESQLSKDVPTIFRSFPEQIVASDEVWSKMAKLAILQFLAKTHLTTSEHKFRTKHRRNILRPDFESLEPILSISNFIFIFWCLFVTQTVSSVWTTHFNSGNRLYRFGYKKAWKCKILHQQNHILKVCIESFQNPVLECLYDLWLWFYANFCVWQKGQKKGWGGTKKKRHNLQNASRGIISCDGFSRHSKSDHDRLESI